MQDAAAKQPSEAERIARLERENAALREQLQQSEGAIERLRRAYSQALEQLQLLHRRLYLAKAERTPAHADQLAFDAMFEQVRRLQEALEDAEAKDDATEKKKRKNKSPNPGHGRRNLAEADLPVVRVEILDPNLEGKAERIGFEDSWRLGYERGGHRRVQVAVAVYKQPEPTPAAPAQEPVPTAEPVAEPIVKAPAPKELFRRGLLAPSMVAHLLVSKYLLGVPFYRLEQQFALQGASLDRGTMCRYAEDAGATLGALVEAMRKEAFETAFCLSTDATGVSIQLGPLAGRERGPCRKGHFFVVLADKDHVFFEYQAKHTSAVVCSMFQGYTGYLQADAHAIYDALFAGRPPRGQPPDPEQQPPIEVGCWSHARRNFWEAAVCKHARGLEGLRRIDALFAADRLLADLAPAQRKVQRDVHVRPLVEAFFAWVHQELKGPPERGLVAGALGYARNQESALRRFLEDGRLRLDNNHSERAARTIATGRKAWLFFGSDDHAQAAGNLFSLLASCKLHGVEPESYLTEVLRLLPYWPRERYLELSPRDWARTRAQLHPAELARPYGPFRLPPPAPEEQHPAS